MPVMQPDYNQNLLVLWLCGCVAVPFHLNGMLCVLCVLRALRGADGCSGGTDQQRAACLCAGRPAGLYADVASGCQKYVNCWASGAALMPCSTGLLFDERYSYCNWWVLGVIGDLPLLHCWGLFCSGSVCE